MSKLNWEEQRLCTDIGEYELIVEKQKRDWECEQKMEPWKWMVVYHGSVVASGSVNDIEEAKIRAEENVPKDLDDVKKEDCGSCSE